ncbi:MAG: hypothetical protein DDT39_01253 [Firmicutes bacterium]|nr:hypothetical protein [candidate division NPL-UPA2 bacterium]
MKVQGTEPVVMAKVIDQTAQQVVKDTRRTAIDLNTRRQQGEHQIREGAGAADVGDEVFERANTAMQALSTRLKFEKHESSGHFMVRVINEETSEVIREIPPERMLDLLVHLRRMVGVLVDERA